MVFSLTDKALAYINPFPTNIIKNARKLTYF